MYYLNKIVWFFCNPLTPALVVACIGVAMLWRGKRRRLGGWMAAVSLAVLWFESTQACVYLLGLPLERQYLPAQDVSSLPFADAAVVLGGGISKTEGMVHPDMNEAADRVWHAARIWKAGKAKVVVVSGTNDLKAAVPLLLDFGVPREAIAVDDKSRNTYENSRFTEQLLKERAKPGEIPSVLVVTSAWHMPRALGNFSRTSLRVVAAPCDFTVCSMWASQPRWWDLIVPQADAVMRTNYLTKEWLGRLARK